MKYHFFKLSAILITLCLSTFQNNSYAQEKTKYKFNTILKFDIASSINPGTLNYIKHHIKKHSSVDAYLLVMDTPGGLLSTTKQIITTFSKAKKPLIIWVGPSGASATSAGAIIASSADFLYMAEGTNIGAATPISTAGDLDKKTDSRQKAVNDITALVRAQAQKHNRNPKPFENMISKAQSYTHKEAIQNKFITGVANTQEELFKDIHLSEFKLLDKTFFADVNTPPTIIEAKMDIGQKLLSVLSSPNLAYLLFLAGAILIYLEFQAPGGFVAGSVGALCLVIAALSFQVLPLNIGALGLIILAFIFFILEIYITSFGLLSITATASLVIGSLFLFRTEDSYISISRSLIFSIIAAILTFIAIIFKIFLKSRKNVGTVKFNERVLQHGEVLEVNQEENTYSIKSHGEYWTGISNEKLVVGDKVTILQKDKNLILKIEKIKE